MRSMKKNLTILISMLIAGILLTGCTESAPSASEKARSDRGKAVETFRKEQPVSAMSYSSTLATINRWADTWGQKGKVSYVYMKRQDGAFDDYYVLDGLPVNQCVGGSPPYDYEDIAGDETTVDVQVPAPGLDGAYYGGCDPSRYYGFDAVTGQYIEYTAGMVLTAIISDQPLAEQVEAYVSSVEEVKKK